MSEDALKARINQLKAELEKKDRENNNLLDRIDELEETIMRLEDLIPEDDSKKKSKKQRSEDSRLAIEIDEKDKQIRELKNSMGFLRKEKLQLQQELDRMKSRASDSSVIRVEDLRTQPPLNILVKELQDTVNKQRSTINRLRSTISGGDDISEKLNQKEEEIEILKSQIQELTQKLNDLSIVSDKRIDDSISKNLIEDLQNQLTKTKREKNELKQKLEKSEKKSKKEDKVATKIESYKQEIHELKDLIKIKDHNIKDLKNQITSLQKAEIAANFEQDETVSSEMIKTLKEDLQNKLNKAKVKIKSLQDQVSNYQITKTPESGVSQSELEGKLKMQRDMAILLQKQLKTKEDEIETIKNEAVQIKRKYRQLENQLKLKEEKLEDLQRQLDNLNIQSHIQPGSEDPQLRLRVKELKNKVENLQKLSNEQKLEISQLRKKI